MNNYKIIGLIFGAILILVGIPATMYLVSQQQDTRSRADTSDFPPPTFPTAQPTQPVTAQQACSELPAPGNVQVSYPNCDGDTCNFFQASCTWNAVTGAENYSVEVIEENTESIVLTQTVPSSTTKVVFDITQGNTYRCEVAGINTCGEAGVLASHSRLCEADALETDPTPTPVPPTPTPTTVAPTATPTPPPADAPTPTPTVPVKTVSPTLAPPGGAETAIAVGAGSALLILLGSLFFFL